MPCSVLNFLDLVVIEECLDRDAANRGRAAQWDHRGTVSPHDHAGDILGREAGLHGDKEAEAAAIECAREADDPVLWETRVTVEILTHGIDRIG